MAFFELEPQETAEIIDWRFAMVASVTAQVGGVKRNKAALKNFLPQREKDQTVQTGRDQAKIIEAFTGSPMPPEISKRFN